MQKSDDEWKQQLSPEQYAVLRQKGTEAPFSGDYLVPDETGLYACAGCNTPLFSTDAQYESTLPGLQGWPSFADAVSEAAIILQDDLSLGMHRTEALCANCGSHLGHLFDDSSSPNGKHYCINSVALEFAPELKK